MFKSIGRAMVLACLFMLFALLVGWAAPVEAWEYNLMQDATGCYDCHDLGVNASIPGTSWIRKGLGLDQLQMCQACHDKRFYTGDPAPFIVTSRGYDPQWPAATNMRVYVKNIVHTEAAHKVTFSATLFSSGGSQPDGGVDTDCIRFSGQGAYPGYYLMGQYKNVDSPSITGTFQTGALTLLKWQDLDWNYTGLPAGRYEIKLFPVFQYRLGVPFIVEMNIRTQQGSPVLLIPGIMASRLYYQNKMIWLSATEALNTPRFLDPLEMNVDGTDINGNGTITTYSGTPGTSGTISDWEGFIVNKVGVGPFTTEYYKAIYDSIVAAGYTPTKGSELGDFSFFAYDWRKSPDDPAIQSALNDRIEALRGHDTTRKVDVVAHSYGGLVIKKYIADHPGVIGKVILVGTPNWGAAKAFRVLQFGDLEFAGSILHRNELMKISQNWGMPYILSPSRNFYDDLPVIFREGNVDLNANGLHPWDFDEINRYYHEGSYYDFWWNTLRIKILNPVHNGTLAEKAVTFHWNYDNPYSWAQYADQVYLLAGQQIATLEYLTLRSVNDIWRLDDHGRSGDGTVPTPSASMQSLGSPPNLSRYYVKNGSHTGMVGEDRTVTDFIGTILRSGVPASLPPRISTTPFPDNLSGRSVEVQCPVDVHVYDAQGNHSGPDSSGLIEQRIEGVSYSRYENEDGFRTTVFLPAGQDYALVLASTGTGTLRLTQREIVEDVITNTAIYDEVPLRPQTTGSLAIPPTGEFAPLLMDRDGDGQSDGETPPTTVITGDERADTDPPVTAVSLAGIPGQNGYFISDVMITLNASDGGGSGVQKTEYSLNGGVSWNRYQGPFVLQGGCLTEVRFRSTDFNYNVEEARMETVRIDQTPPVIHSFAVSPTVLWPPNHRLVEVVPAASLSDNCAPAVSWTIEQIMMNEGDLTDTFDPVYDAQAQAGQTAGDIQVVGNTISLRAERAGNSPGRTYSLVLKAIDSAGNVSRANAIVTVPHDYR